MSGERGMVFGLCGAVAIAALVDLQVGLRGSPDMVPEAQMKAAAQALERAMQPGDVIVHSPLLSVTELGALGDIKARPDRPRPEILASRRVLLLDRVQDRMFGLGTPKTVERVGEHLELRVYEPRGDLEVPVFDLYSDLASGMMSVERPPGQRVSSCTQPRAEGGWSCPSQDGWLYAAPRTLRIGGSDQDCVWAHPTTGGAIVFTIPPRDPPLAGRQLVLQLEGGLADDAVTGTPDGASVFIEVRQGKRSLGRLTVPNAVGWHPLELAVAPGQAIALSITTPRDGRRHHCINAQILERPEARR